MGTNYLLLISSLLLIFGCKNLPLKAGTEGSKSIYEAYERDEVESHRYLSASAQFYRVIFFIRANLAAFVNDEIPSDFAQTFSKQFLEHKSLSNIYILNLRIYDQVNSEVLIERLPGNIISIKRVPPIGVDFADYVLIEARLDGQSGEIISFMNSDKTIRKNKEYIRK